MKRSKSVLFVCVALLTGWVSPSSAELDSRAPEIGDQAAGTNDRAVEVRSNKVDVAVRGRQINFEDIKGQAIAAERALSTALASLNDLPDSKMGDPKSDRLKRAYTAIEQSRQGRLASLMSAVRELPPSMPLENLNFYEVDGNYAFALKGVELLEFHDQVAVDETGKVVAEEIGLLQEKGPEIEAVLENVIDVPSNRSFGYDIWRDGYYSWRNGNIGRVRIYWSKALSGSGGNGYGTNPDWMFYTGMTEAEVWDTWWEDRWIYDVDTINGVTSGSMNAHIHDTPRVGVNAPQEGCSDIAVGAYGVKVGLYTCARTSIKSDRIGGKHVEFRNDNVWWSDTRPIITDRRFFTGYSQEVKTKSIYAMYWWDYGDACFDRTWDGYLDCDEEVVR